MLSRKHFNHFPPHTPDGVNARKVWVHSEVSTYDIKRNINRLFIPRKQRKSDLSSQPMIPPKRFDIFPLAGGCSEGEIFLNN